MNDFLNELKLMNINSYFDNENIKVFFSLEYVDNSEKHLLVDKKLLEKNNLNEEYFKSFLTNISSKQIILTIEVMDYETIDNELMEEEYDEYLQSNAEDDCLLDFDGFVKQYNEDNAYCEVLKILKRVMV